MLTLIMLFIMLISDHVTRLRSLYKPLSEKLIASSLANALFQRDALSLVELERIQLSRDTPSLAAEQLMNILMRSPRETYNCFLDALKRTRQIDAYMWLVLEGESGTITRTKTLTLVDVSANSRVRFWS